MIGFICDHCWGRSTYAFDLEAAEWAILAGHSRVEKHLGRKTFMPFQWVENRKENALMFTRKAAARRPFFLPSSLISGIGFIVILWVPGHVTSRIEGHLHNMVESSKDRAGRDQSDSENESGELRVGGVEKIASENARRQPKDRRPYRRQR